LALITTPAIDCNGVILAQVVLSTEEQAYTFSALVKEAAIELGFTSFKASLISLAVSEITINAIRYANGATAEIKKTENNKGLSIQIEDSGPGIDDIDLAMTSGYSTYHSLGLGLGAAKSAVDDMTLNTSTSGTIICLTSYLPISIDSIDIGIVSFPKVNRYYNRNGYCIKPYHGESLLAVVCNCLENKKHLQAALLLATTFIKENYALPLKVLIKQCHLLLQKNHYSQGMDMGILRITPNKVESIVIGNITIKPLLPASKSINQLSGRLGIEIPEKLTTTVIESTSQFCFALHSNGIKSTELPNYHPLELYSRPHAEEIFDAFAIADDDATIMVVKSNG